MKNVKNALSSFEDIKEFNRITCMYDLSADLSTGNYKVNPRSLIGLFTLDTGKKLNLTIYSDNYNDYLERIGKFLVD